MNLLDDIFGEGTKDEFKDILGYPKEDKIEVLKEYFMTNRKKDYHTFKTVLVFVSEAEGGLDILEINELEERWAVFKVMTKEELNSRTDTELTPTENALINFNIYHNPKHVEYYQNFHMGDYQWCYDYLVNNRHLLTIKHTPNGHKRLAKKAIKMAKKYYS